VKFAIALALLLPSSGLVGASVRTVPVQFQGHWAASLGSCGAEADELDLRIGMDHISYWESDGPVRAIVVRGVREIALVSELSGEGETWLAVAKFELSADGARLIDSTTSPGHEVVRVRCPESQPNNAFKPNSFRSTNSVAGTACHAVCSATRVGLT
jgi:hypothetical protein